MKYNYKDYVAGSHLAFFTVDKMEEKPKQQELELLKYKNDVQTTRIRIIHRASHKWRDIAAIICGDTNKIDILEQRCDRDPVRCLRQVLVENFLNKKPAEYPQTWEGLIELLRDIDLDDLAEDVEHVIRDIPGV